jgi:hypothetical protein
VLNYLRTKPWRRMGEWKYRSTFSWPRHQLEVSGQLDAPAALPPGKRPLYPVDRRLGVPQNLYGLYREGKILSLPGLELRPLGSPARSQLLYRLSYPGYK